MKKLGEMKSPPRVLDEFTQRHYLETKANSIINSGCKDYGPKNFFRPIACATGVEFQNQSHKSRYFKVLKELQMIKSKITISPHSKMEIANGFIMLHTRYNPSKEETKKFIKFLVSEKVIPSNLSLKEAIFYMLTFDPNFDIADRDGYGILLNKSREIGVNQMNQMNQTDESKPLDQSESIYGIKKDGFSTHRYSKYLLKD
jgi:hypothetical protein